MSVKSMALVWDSDLPREEKYILLAYADHADHEGQNIYPSVGLVSWKTGYSERAVQLITRKLVELEILIFEKISNLGTNQYRIDFSNLPSRLPYSRKRGAKISPPNDNEGVQNLPQGVQKTAGGGEKIDGGGVIAIAPDPSFKPSNNPPIEPEESIHPIWPKFLAYMKSEMESKSPQDRAIFQEKIAPLAWGGRPNGAVILCAPDALSAAWLQERMGRTFERAFDGFPELAGAEVIFVPEREKANS